MQRDEHRPSAPPLDAHFLATGKKYEPTPQAKPTATTVLSMLLVVIGSVAALVGIAVARRAGIIYALQWAKLQIDYNLIAVKSIFLDRTQAKYNKTELPQMPGRVAIVTGGARGIGAEIVKMLLMCDMDVVIACRRTNAGTKTVEEIKKSGIPTEKAKVMELDNASLDSVRRFVEVFKNNYEKLDILVNNAGIMFTPYRETKDGFEEQYGVNYLSHFLLTMLLIPSLQKAGSSECNSRIVNVSSCAHLVGIINFADINYKENFLTGAAYAQSKLAQLLFTKSLTRQFSEKKLPIMVNAVHPGVVSTNLFDHSYLRHFKLLRELLFKTPIEGATPIVYAAVSPRLEGTSGLYISNCLEAPVKPLANDEALQDRLFELSLKQVGLQSALT